MNPFLPNDRQSVGEVDYSDEYTEEEKEEIELAAQSHDYQKGYAVGMQAGYQVCKQKVLNLLEGDNELGQWADKTTGSAVHEYPSDEEQGIEREDND